MINHSFHSTLQLQPLKFSTPRRGVFPNPLCLDTMQGLFPRIRHSGMPQQALQQQQPSRSDVCKDRGGEKVFHDPSEWQLLHGERIRHRHPSGVSNVVWPGPLNNIEFFFSACDASREKSPGPLIPNRRYPACTSKIYASKLTFVEHELWSLHSLELSEWQQTFLVIFDTTTRMSAMPALSF